MDDKRKGIYRKYKVERVDGSDKHKDCEYFVLDPKHDPHARVALKAYANSCEADGYLTLARDINMMVKKAERS